MPEECDVDEIYLDRRYKVFIIFDDCSAPELEMKTEPLEGDLIKLPRIRGGMQWPVRSSHLNLI